MKEDNFKVGDTVTIRKWDDMAKQFGVGNLGFIKSRCKFVPNMKEYCGKKARIESIVTDNIFNLSFGGRKVHWNFSTDMFEPVSETIVIYRKDSKVIALDKRSGDKAVAKCSPEDEFNFDIGAKLAFERLMEIKKEPKYYTGKIIFTQGDSVFKTGHIYEVKDGYIQLDDEKFPTQGEPLKDLDDVKDYFTSNMLGKRKRKRKYGWAPVTLELIEVLDD